MLARSIRFRRYLPIRLTQYISALPFSHFIHRFCSDYAGEQCSPLRVNVCADQSRGVSRDLELFRYGAKFSPHPCLHLRGEGVGASRRMRWNQIRAAQPHTYSYQLSAIEKTAVCAAVFHISSTDKTLGRAVMAGTSSVPLILGVVCTDKSA